MNNKNEVMYIIKTAKATKNNEELSYFKLMFYYKIISCIGWGLGFLSIFLYFNNKVFLLLFGVAIIWLIFRLLCIFAYQYQNIFYFKNSGDIYFYENHLCRKTEFTRYKGLYKYLAKMNNKLFKSLSSNIQYSQIKCLKMTKESLLIMTRYEYICIPKELYSLDLICFLSTKLKSIPCTNETKQSIDNEKIDTAAERYYAYDALNEYIFGKLDFIIKLLIVSAYLMFTTYNNYFIVGIIDIVYTVYLLFYYYLPGNVFYKKVQKVKSVFFSNKKIYLLKFQGDEKLYQFLNDEDKREGYILENLLFTEDKRYIHIYINDEDKIVLFDKKRQDVDLKRIINKLL